VNEQLPISLPVQFEMELSLPERAQRIRDLVGTARLCIIEIGRELMAAGEQVAQGDWGEWLRTEFDWPESTARGYIQIAKAFRPLPGGGDYANLTIDAKALTALASPEVPQLVRDEAVSRAAAGEHISKADADAMIERSVKAAVEHAIVSEREAIALTIEEKNREAEDLRDLIEAARGDGLREAQDTLAQLESAYDEACAERDAARAEMANPTEDQVIRLVAMLCKKKPSRLMLVAIASALNRAITYNGKDYAPLAEAELAQLRRDKAAADEKLKDLFDPHGAPSHWHKALMALRTLNEVASVEMLMAKRYDGFDHAFQKELPKAEQWIIEFARRMRDVGTEPAVSVPKDQGKAKTGKSRSRI
jgi:Protein of unknown function (DUF3102)